MSAMFANWRRDLRELRGWCAGPLGVSEDVQIGEWQALDEGAGVFEFGVSFAGETRHDIGSDRAIGHQRASLGDAIGIVAGAVLAMHAAQDRIRSRLQRSVYMFRDSIRGRHQSKKIV